MSNEMVKTFKSMEREIERLKVFDVPFPPTYGSMWGDDINVTVVIAVTDTYYPVDSGLTGGACSGIVFQNARELRILTAGVYLVNWSLTMKVASGLNTHAEGAVMVNATGQMNTVNATHLSTSNDEQGVSGTGILTLAVGDVVKLAVENETGTVDLVVDHANLTLLRIR